MAARIEVRTYNRHVLATGGVEPSPNPPGSSIPLEAAMPRQ
jgi:hypothetical protein